MSKRIGIGGTVAVALALLVGCSAAPDVESPEAGLDEQIAEPVVPADAGPIEVTWDRPDLVEACFGPIATNTDLNAGGTRTWALAEFPTDIPAPKAPGSVTCHQVSPTDLGQIEAWWLTVKDSVEAYTIGDQWIADLAAAGITELSDAGFSPRTPEPNMSYNTEVTNVDRTVFAFIYDTPQGYRFQAQFAP